MTPPLQVRELLSQHLLSQREMLSQHLLSGRDRLARHAPAEHQPRRERNPYTLKPKPQTLKP